MKTKRIFTFILSVLVCLCNIAITDAYGAEYPEAVIKKYGTMLEPVDNSAYVIMGEKIETRHAAFYDGIKEGIADPGNPIYSEITTLDGLDARYFYKENYGYIKVGDDYFEKGDNEFLIQIMYYDFGPDVGYFHFEYYTENGELQRISLKKAGEVQEWFTQIVYISNADFAKCFENGANLRLVSNVYNAFKKVEVINISKLKRESTAVNPKYLPSDSRTSLETLGIVQPGDERFVDSSLSEGVSVDLAWEIMQVMQGKAEAELPLPEAYLGKTNLSQGELLTLYMGVLGIDPGDDPVNTAYDSSLVEGKSLILQKDAPASRYNLLSLAHKALYYKMSDGLTLLSKLVLTGHFDNIDISKIVDSGFMAEWYRAPRKIPKQQYTDNETGRTYYYMTINGMPTYRPYVTEQVWASDGKRMIVGLQSGPMFTYNIETEMLTYIDYCDVSDRMQAMMGVDDCIYYIKRVNNKQELWKADINTLEAVKIGEPPSGVSIFGINISNDCNYIGVDCGDLNRLYSKPEDSLNMAGRFCISTGEWDFFPHKWDFDNYITHTQVNVGYPEILFFCHEGGNRNIYDRAWSVNAETGEKSNFFKQGRMGNGQAIQLITHEVWSNTGDYMYIVIPDIWGANPYGRGPSVARVDKDGRHRQYFIDNKLTYLTDHAYPSGDDRFIVFDGPMICLMSTETNQVIPLARWEGYRYQAHPNQPHPVIARDLYVVSWGTTMNGVTSVMWMDFTDIAQNEFAKGGRYPVGKTAERVSYQGLDCESRELTYKGKECYHAATGKSLFIDIDESVVDSTDAKIKIAFDYIDNGTQPLVIKYTSGVKSDDDCYRIYDNQKQVKRTGTGKWKHAEVVIESGNFENIGEYFSDLKFGGNLGATYIANINIERID